MKVSSPQALEFACHSAACRPPTSGGTGGSGNGKGRSGVAGVDRVMGRDSKYGKNKFDLGAKSAESDAASIKGGAVHYGGKAITGKIRKTRAGYEATMRGSEHTSHAMKNGKAVRRAAVVIGNTKNAVKIAAVERVVAHQAYREKIAAVNNPGGWSQKRARGIPLG